MTDEQKLDAEEIARRIVTGVGLVYDVVNELNALLRMIVEGLRSSEEFDVINAKFFRLPVPRGAGRTPADKSMPLDRGLVLELGVAGDEEDEDEGEGVADDAEEEESADERRGMKITPESKFLAIRAVLYDRQQVERGGFVPRILAGMLGGMERVPKGKPSDKRKRASTFEIKRGVLLQLAKRLDGTVSPGKTVTFRAWGYEFTATVTSIVSRPLGEFDSEESVDAFVEQLAKMAEGAGP